MIYLTTFIFTLLLSHITHAVPACGDAPSPKNLYDPMYDDVQQPLLADHKVTWDSKYDHKHRDTKTVDCPKLANRFPHFIDFPDFPYIGGAFNVKHNSPNCGKCWKLRNKKNNITISLTAIDSAETGFKISKEAFEKLHGGKPGKALEAEAHEVPPSVCGF